METLIFFSTRWTFDYLIQPLLLQTKSYVVQRDKATPTRNPASQLQTQVCAALNAVLFPLHHAPSLFSIPWLSEEINEMSMVGFFTKK